MTMTSKEFRAAHLALIAAVVDWTMDRVFNPKGYYDDGAPFRTFEELLSRENAWRKANQR